MDSKCQSIRSKTQPNLRCLFNAKNGNKYCPLHLIQNNIIDFNPKNEEFFSTVTDNNNEHPQNTINPIYKQINLDTINSIGIKTFVTKDLNKKDNGKDKTTGIKKKIKNSKSVSSKMLHEQKVTTIADSYQNTEDDLEMKLLILINNEENLEKISKLIGPAFNDLTLAEDNEDPVTYDQFWTVENGIKKPSGINRYFIFSYIDSNDKIRCFTIMSINDLISRNNLEHPITMEKIPEEDIIRAIELIDFYKKEIGLFNSSNMEISREFQIKHKLSNLFKKFHVHSIYLEENWLLDITNLSNLDKIIHETNKLISNNLVSINPNLKTFDLFKKKFTVNSSKNKKILETDSNTTKETYIDAQWYIVEQWEKLIELADNINNQIPIWVLILGLSYVVPEIKQKFPDLEIML